MENIEMNHCYNYNTSIIDNCCETWTWSVSSRQWVSLISRVAPISASCAGTDTGVENYTRTHKICANTSAQISANTDICACANFVEFPFGLQLNLWQSLVFKKNILCNLVQRTKHLEKKPPVHKNAISCKDILKYSFYIAINKAIQLKANWKLSKEK